MESLASMVALASNHLVLFILEEWKLLTFLTTVFLLYYHYTSNFDFFEKRGIKFMKPTIVLGNLGPILTMKVSFHEFHLQIYNHFKGEPYGGIFEGKRPILYVFDPDLIKAVMIRDFDHFVDRNSLDLKLPPYVGKSLVHLKGNEWKGVRSVLTPTFSSARLKNMLPLIQQCSDQMVDFLKQYDQKDVEMKDIMGHFTLEVIGACAFGIECDAYKNKESHFVEVAKKFDYIPVPKRILIFFVLMFMPGMFKHLGIAFTNLETASELVRMLTAKKAERRSAKTKSNDFLQLMIDAAEKEQQDTEKDKTKKFLDEGTIDAQCLFFLLAGYETTSTLLSFAIHVLATRPALQHKLRAHVMEADGKEMDYDVLAQMHYLEAFLHETLRLYSPLARVGRVVNKRYTVPGTGVTLQPGQVVAIPIHGIHMDERHYPSPSEFRPERFLGDEKRDRPAHLFLPFGAGPRNCIGLRFAMLSAKLAMVMLLKNFKFSTCDRTEDPVRFERKGLLLKAEHGLWVTIEAIA